MSSNVFASMHSGGARGLFENMNHGAIDSIAEPGRWRTRTATGLSV